MLRASDVFTFLVPGSDGTCRALLEAAACGIPAVTRRGALPEIVLHGETGLVVERTRRPGGGLGRAARGRAAAARASAPPRAGAPSAASRRSASPTRRGLYERPARGSRARACSVVWMELSPARGRLCSSISSR